MSLFELYSRIPEGLWYPLTKKLGFPVLLMIIGLNCFFIRRYFHTDEAKKILNIFKWIGVFSLLYILLLPLGGYRGYRPNVLRYDTIMPITVSLIFIFGISTLFLIKNLKGIQRICYIPLITGVLLFYTINDEQHFDKNKCERNALKEIAASKDSIVRLHGDCKVLSWQKITKPEDSGLYAELLTLWNVSPYKKLYCNE